MLSLLEHKNVLTSLVYCAYKLLVSSINIDITVISLSQHLLWQYCMSSNSLCKGRGFSSKPEKSHAYIERMKDIQIIVSVQFVIITQSSLRQFQAVYVFNIMLFYCHTGEILAAITIADQTTNSLQVFIASHCLPLHHLRMVRSQSVLALLSPSPVLPVKLDLSYGEIRM